MITDALVLVCRRPPEVKLQPGCFDGLAIREEQDREDDGVDDDKSNSCPDCRFESLAARASHESTVEHQNRDLSEACAVEK